MGSLCFLCLSQDTAPLRDKCHRMGYSHNTNFVAIKLWLISVLDSLAAFSTV